MKLELFSNLFVNRRDAYYVQVPNQRRYQARYRSLTTGEIERHLNGKETLALPAVSRESTSRWIAFDSDHSEGHLNRAQALLLNEGWHVLLESRREDREGHLWLLLDEPIQSEYAIRFGAEVLARIGAMKKLEVIPKQSKPDKLGSSLRLPLGINMKPNIWQRGWFEGPPRNVEDQLSWLVQQPLNRAARLTKIAEELIEQDRRREERTFIPTDLISRNYNSQKIDLLQFLPSTGHRRRCGNDWVTQCPVCAREGHDKSEDNLRIKGDDGTLFACWYGGQPGRLHTARMILDAYGA